jgi:hypothetical protein
MGSSIGRRLQAWFLSGCSVGVVMAGLAAINDTCRQYIFGALHGEVPDVLPVVRVQAVTRQIVNFLPMDHTALMVFGAVALVLTVIMFKM